MDWPWKVEEKMAWLDMFWCLSMWRVLCSWICTQDKFERLNSNIFLSLETLDDMWTLDMKRMYWNRIELGIQISPGPPCLYRHTMNVLGTSALFIFGGWKATGELSCHPWLYLLNENCWKRLDGSSLQGRAGHTTTSLLEKGETFLICGGEVCRKDSLSRCLSGEVYVVKIVGDELIVLWATTYRG